MRKFLTSALALILCLVMMTACSHKDKGGNTSSNSSTNSNIVSSEESTSSEDKTSSEETGDTSSVQDETEDTSSNEDNLWQEDESESSVNANEVKIPEIIPTGNTSVLLNNMKGGADVEAEILRDEIINTKDKLKITGTTYYISPDGDDYNDGTSPETAWQTCDAITLNSWMLQSGDAVLFERGGVYRPTSTIYVKSGLTFGAYGKGAKPMIYGSTENFAKPGYWTPSKKKNVWKLNITLEDAGTIVFNHGEAVGVKKTGLLGVTKNFDFYHNTTDNTLYLYLDKGRPNQVYMDIEIATKRHMFLLSRKVKDVRIDNLAMKYTGSFAISAEGDNANVKITNCEIGWIGGSMQNSTSRYGNGIQFWDSADNCTIENCWVYQCYDAGITFQGSAGSVYNNINFCNNLIEYCSFNIEFFVQNTDTTGNDGTMTNIYMNDNILRFAGYGWGKQRDNSTAESAINGWSTICKNTTNFNIKNNIFDLSYRNLIYWYWDSSRTQLPLNISGNTYYQSTNLSGQAILYASAGQQSANDQVSLEKAIAVFDTSPKLVKWIS